MTIEIEQFKAQNDANLAKWKADVEHGLEQWKVQCQFQLESWRAVIGFANITIKSLLLANGGALITLMAFLGKSDNPKNLLSQMMPSIKIFLVGMFLSILVSGLSYLGQMFFAHNKNKIGLSFQCLAILIAIISWLSFGLGSFLATIAS